jgi:hypothetical protein
MNRLSRRPYPNRASYVPRLEALEGREVPTTCVVNSLGDAGVGVAADHGDLRFCLSQSNARPGEDLIIFSVTGTINLTKALPDISDNLIIAGPGADQLIVRAHTGGAYRVLTVAAGTVQVYGLTLANGRADVGGGVYNQGTLTLNGVAVTANASTAGQGGGVYNGGSLDLINCTVSANTVSGNSGINAGYGGGIYNAPSAVLAVTASTILGNSAGWTPTQYAYGGGVANVGTASIWESTVSGNTATGHSDAPALAFGGGIANLAGATMAIGSSTVSKNQAHATALSEGSSDYGGGIFNENQGLVVVVNSTVALNTAGPGDFDYSTDQGGGIYTDGALTIESSTVASNDAECGFLCWGGGIGLGTPSSATLRNTVVAGNTAGSQPDDLVGDMNSLGYNLFGKSSGGSGYARTDLLDVDPKLGPLQDNGGPTLTMALLPGSPAIDSGNNTGAPEWDQRGPGYPRIVNGTIDRGAFEVQNTAGPAGGRSTLATALRPATATFAMPLEALAEASHRQPPATIPAPAAVPGVAGKLAAPLIHAGHLPAAVPDSDADPLGLAW